MKPIIFSFFLLTLISCSKQKIIIEKNKYNVLNLLYKDISDEQLKFYAFPKRPLSIKNQKITLSNADSIVLIDNYLKNKKNYKIFAINPLMYRYHNLKKENNLNIPENYKYLFEQFKKSKIIDSLNINKIIPKNHDSILELKKSILDKGSGVEYLKFDILLEFSNITFSINKKKAIVIATRSFSRTDSHSLIYYLEKENEQWKVKFKNHI